MSSCDDRPGQDTPAAETPAEQTLEELTQEVTRLRDERDRALAARDALVREVLPLTRPPASVMEPPRRRPSVALLLVGILFLGLIAFLALQHQRVLRSLSEEGTLHQRPRPAAPVRPALPAPASPTGGITIFPITELPLLGKMALAPDGHTLALSSSEGLIGLYQLGTGLIQQLLRGHHGEVRDVVFTTDGRRLVSGGEDGRVQLWLRGKSTPHQVLASAGPPVQAIALTRETVAVATENPAIRLWSLSGGKPARLSGHAGWVTALSFSPNGRRLASGGHDALVQIWDVQARKIVQTLRKHSLWISALAFHPGGQLLVSAGLDRRVLVWNLKSGKAIQQLRGHVREVTSLAFNKAGTVLATASLDRTIILWDIKTGRQRFNLTGHRWQVSSVTFTPDNRHLISASSDGTVRRWPFPPAFSPVEAPLPPPGPGELTLRNNTTGERLRLRLMDGQGNLDPAAQPRLARFLRSGADRRQGPMDPQLLERLYHVADHFGRRREIVVISGFRSRQYNTLRTKQSREVGKESKHMAGQAIDFRIEGITITALKRYVKGLRAGGVGFYADSQFIHLDTGPVRYWEGT